MAKYGLDFGTTTTKIFDLTGSSVFGRSIEDTLIESPRIGNFGSLKRELYVGTKSAGRSLTDHEVDVCIRDFLRNLATEAKKRGADLAEPGSVRLGTPAIWDGEARRRLVRIAKEAGLGLDDFTIAEEATAAAAGWAEKSLAESGVHQAIVFDMGGGTLDVAVLRTGGGPNERSLEILACVGNSVAGDFLDEALESHIKSREKLADTERFQFSKAKEELSSLEKVTLGVKSGAASGIEISRAELVHVAESSGFLQHIRSTIDFALRRAKFNMLIDGVLIQNSISNEIRHAKSISFEELQKDIDSVVLVGGMQRMPIIRDLLSELFPFATFYESAQKIDGKAKPVTDVGARSAVALGMLANSTLETANLDRWPYEVWLEYGSSKVLLIDAYQELLSPEAVRNEFKRACFVSYPRDLPNSGVGKIVVRALNGNQILASWKKDGELGKGPLEFAFGQFTSPRVKKGDENPPVNVYVPRVIAYSQGVLRLYDGVGFGQNNDKEIGGQVLYFEHPIWRRGSAKAATLFADVYEGSPQSYQDK